ncbi:MAG: hybrid sensor histidine kinase/response regulator [Candidatus Acidiferrales bacterium]
MANKPVEADFLKKLQATFAVEAREHVDALSQGLVTLEKAATPEQRAASAEATFREAHSLKGAARAVNRTGVEMLCHELERVLNAFKRNELAQTPEVFDELHQVVDTLNVLLTATEGEQARLEKSRLPEVAARLRALLGGGLPPAPSRAPSREAPREAGLLRSAPVAGPVVEEKPALPETVRISTAKLGTLLLRAEELLPSALAAAQLTEELRQLKAALLAGKKEWTKLEAHRRSLRQKLENWTPEKASRQGNGQLEKAARLAKLLEGPEKTGTFFATVERNLSTLVISADQHHRAISRLIDEQLDAVKDTLMLPFSSLWENFPKAVRALARDRGKEVDLVLRGGEVEIDRRILETMKDPLIHLMRNCIDHGIEKPEDRVAKNKPRRGTIALQVRRSSSSHVEILVADDGAGIDLPKVRTAALRSGLLSAEEAEKVAEDQLLALVFVSGLSTSSLITDISGQGVGLAIVQEKVEALGGRVSVKSQACGGTEFRMDLPARLVTFRGILVRVGEHLYVFPAAEVQRVARVSREEVKTVENRETTQLNGHPVSLVWLGDLLRIGGESARDVQAQKLPVLLARAGEKRAAFVVDEVLGDTELLVKKLPQPLARVPNIAAATLLGSGRVVPVLHVPDLIKASGENPPDRLPPATAEGEPGPKKSVLVVEDSITARTLLKNIFDGAGYQVQTAVDGVDAFTQLRSGQFDLVVSDVEMPRMNGFDLTARIRSETKLKDLPVVLVTALESREDRERGIDVGANAYIVKRSFDQNNLLETVRRLI